MRKFTLTFLLCLIIGSVSAQNTTGNKKTRLDRGIQKTTFIEKGQWFVGGTASYMSLNSEDFKFPLIEKMNASAYGLSTKVLGGYAWKDDIGAGIGFDYERTMIDLPKLQLDLGDDTEINIDDFYSIQQTYTGTAFIRTYLNIGNTRRFALFNDVKLYLGGGRGKILNGQGEEMTGTYQKIFKAGLVIQPGVSVFITDYVAAEASVGLFGVRYNRTDQITNQIDKGHIETLDASFKFNILAINMGVTFYF